VSVTKRIPRQAILTPDAKPVIAEVVALVKDNPAFNLSVNGYTDEIGTSDHNLKLSQDRAAAVVDALAAAGIARDRLRSAGFGAAAPIADNETPEGRAKNRRVELVKM
jgi:outer membrane protein OmpA-like peptidoglycan-associated protein